MTEGDEPPVKEESQDKTVTIVDDRSDADGKKSGKKEKKQKKKGRKSPPTGIILLFIIDLFSLQC